MARYINQFHVPGHPGTGPAFYETDATPTEYRGYLIYRRLPHCFDIVSNGLCVANYAGLKGAQRAIDTRFGAALAESAYGDSK